MRPGRRTLQTNEPRRAALDPDLPDTPARVRQALAALGPCRDTPAHAADVAEVEAGLRRAFGLDGARAVALSGPPEAALETALVNLIPPGEAVVAIVNGPASEQLARQAERAGAEVIRVDHEAGAPIEYARVEAALWARGARLCTLVQADAATGCADDPQPVCALAREHGALSLVEGSASLGAPTASAPLDARSWNADVVAAGAAVAWGVPEGVGLLALGPAATAALQARRTAPFTYAFDLARPDVGVAGLPVPLLLALKAALAVRRDPPGESRRERLQPALAAGLDRLGLEPGAPAERAAAGLVVALAPPTVDAAQARRRMQAAFGLEAGLYAGPQGQGGWRFGLLSPQVGAPEVRLALVALADALRMQGVDSDPSLALQAADALLEGS